MNINFRMVVVWLLGSFVIGVQAHERFGERQVEIVPTKMWNDMNGEYINAHGGGILTYGGKYYWFGEHRPATGFATEVGVSCYSSTDLHNWKYENVALAVSQEAGSEIEKGCIIRVMVSS